MFLPVFDGFLQAHAISDSTTNRSFGVKSARKIRRALDAPVIFVINPSKGCQLTVSE